MPKMEQKSSSRRFPTLLIATLLGIGGWWLWNSPSLENWRDQIFHYIDNRDIVTLEAHYTPEQIIESHRSEIFGTEKRTLQNTSLKYYPYLLLDIKYPELSKTREGILLWGMHDGEIVLNADTWEKTHGFKDCLECHANRSDFKIIQTLARRQNMVTVEDLQKELKVERDVLDSWVEQAKKKHLVIQKGNFLQLHFENPKMLVFPQTRINQHFVNKPRGDGQKMSRNYSRNQIIEMTKAAFGNDVKIREEQEIFLPVFSLEILNPDGSIKTTEWNALTGLRIIPHYLRPK